MGREEPKTSATTRDFNWEFSVPRKSPCSESQLDQSSPLAAVFLGKSLAKRKGGRIGRKKGKGGEMGKEKSTVSHDVPG